MTSKTFGTANTDDQTWIQRGVLWHVATAGTNITFTVRDSRAGTPARVLVGAHTGIDDLDGYREATNRTHARLVIAEWLSLYRSGGTSEEPFGIAPVSWPANGVSYSEIGVWPSPEPMVRRDGFRVRLTGVRFTHSNRCLECRDTLSVATEGGEMELGFRPDGWSYERLRAGDKPVWPITCPMCGFTDTEFPGRPVAHPSYEFIYGEGRPVANAQDAFGREWPLLRERLGVAGCDMTHEELLRHIPGAKPPKPRPWDVQPKPKRKRR